MLAALFGASLAVGAAQANRTADVEVAVQRQALQQRVEAARQALNGARVKADQARDKVDVSQWFNWPNWNNWNNWPNWGNWGNWFNR